MALQEKIDIKRAIASNILSAVQTLLENSTSEAWSEQMEDDARIIEALNLRGVHPKVSENDSPSIITLTYCFVILP